MSEIRTILEDDREIDHIYQLTQVEGGDGWRVGYDKVTRIVAYEERGECGLVPWFAVFKEGPAPAVRVPAHSFIVGYKP